MVHIIRKCPCFTLQKLSYYVFWHVHTVLTDIWGALEPPLIRTLCLPPSCIKFTSACDDSSRSASPLATYLHAPPLLEICSKSHVCMYLSMYYLVNLAKLWNFMEIILTVYFILWGLGLFIPFSADFIFCWFHFLLIPFSVSAIFCSFHFLLILFSADSIFLLILF